MKRLVPVLIFAVVLFSCQKKTNPLGNRTTFITELQAQSQDAVFVGSELDAFFNDIDSGLENHANVCGGAYSLNNTDTPNVMTIAYSGNTCDGLRSRSGTVTVSYTPGSSWSTAGDTVTVSFTGLYVTRSDRALAFVGTFNYINVSGGTLAGLTSGSATPVVHDIAGSNVSVIFDNGASTNWRFTRRRTYTYNQGVVISTIGMDSAGTVGNVADWGSNRFGNSTLLVPTTPLQLSQSCGWKLTGGVATLSNPSGTSTLGFGLDSTGKATGCPVSGTPYYYQLSWTGDGENPYNVMLPYFY